MTRHFRTACVARLLLLLLLLPAATQAQDYSYTTNADNTLTITGYTGSGGDVTIPDTINGLPVTSIGEWVFESASLTSVTIPNSIINIGEGAFMSCAGLTSVTFPNSVTNIGTNAFAGCGLTNVMIGPGVTNIGEGAFMDCFSLTSVTIPNSVTSIGTNAFAWCSLTNVMIGNGVTNIGYEAFSFCYGLTSVYFQGNAPSIGTDVFGGDNNVTVYYLPGTTGWENFAQLAGVPTLPLPFTYTTNADNTITITGYTGPGGDVTIPDAIAGLPVTGVANKVFHGCTSLNRITIPSSVTNIGIWVLSDCANLTSIMVDASNPVFCGVAGVLFDKSTNTLIQCPGAMSGSYTVPNSVTSLGLLAFGWCAGLTNITIPNSVTNIGNGAFAFCTSLAGITIPNSVTNIGNGAFSECTSLASIIIGSNVANVGDIAFQDCTNLTSLYFQGNAPGVGSMVFFGDHKVTIYYLPGTTGWGNPPTFLALPMLPWLPQMQIIGPVFGLQTNQFGFNINWASGQTVVVEACTDLANPVWSPVATNTLTGGSSYFSDPYYTNYHSRFYRLRSP